MKLNKKGVMIMINFDVKVGRANASETSYKITLPKKAADFIDVTIGDSVRYELHNDGTITLSKVKE